MSISLKDVVFPISRYNPLAGMFGLDHCLYLNFKEKFTMKMEKQIRDRIEEILNEEGGPERLEKAVNDPNPKTLQDLYGYNWIYTDKTLLWWGEKKQIQTTEWKNETNLKKFEYQVEKREKREREEKLWKIYNLNQEYFPYMGSVRLGRLRKEAQGRLRRSLSMSDISLKEDENELFVEYINGRWKYIDHPPLPQLGMPWKRKMEKKKRGPLR